MPIRAQMIVAALFALIIFPIALASRLEKVSPEAELEFRE
jgi:hypothetical protein